MRPERMAALAARWVRFYTRDLPAGVARRRIDEIDADLHDHIASGRAAGAGDRRIAREIASRMLRGLVADAAWRRHQAQAAARPPSPEERMKTHRRFLRAAVRVAFGVAIVLSLPLVAMQFSDEVVWSLADFVLAGALLTVIGVTLELAARKAGNLGAAIGIAALGVVAGILGESDDAPGLVLLGILLIGSACVLAVRRLRARHSS